MASNYKGSNPTYIDDFIYQPPYKLMQEALANKNKIVDDAVDNIDLLYGIDFNYWEDVDKERAKALKDEYHSSAEEMYKMLQENLEDPKVFNMIKMMRRKLKDDYSQDGRIYKLEENLKRWDTWKSELDKKNLSEDEKISYLKAVEEYKRNNPEGAYSGFFEGPKIFEQWDAVGDFLKSDYFKQLHPDIKNSITDRNTLNAIITDTNNRKFLGLKEKILPAFKAFINNNSFFKEYSDVRSKYIGEKYYDEDGNIVFDKDGYVPYSWGKQLAPYEYEEKTDGRTLKIKPRYGGNGGGRTPSNIIKPGSVTDVNIKEYFFKTKDGINNTHKFVSESSALIKSFADYFNENVANKIKDQTRKQQVKRLVDTLKAMSNATIDRSVINDLYSNNEQRLNRALQKLEANEMNYSKVVRATEALLSNKDFYNTYVKGDKNLETYYNLLSQKYNNFNISMTTSMDDVSKYGFDPQTVEKMTKSLKNVKGKYSGYFGVLNGLDNIMLSGKSGTPEIVSLNQLGDLIRQNADKIPELSDIDLDKAQIKVKDVQSVYFARSMFEDENGREVPGFYSSIVLSVSMPGKTVAGIPTDSGNKEIYINSYIPAYQFQQKLYKK